MGRSAKIEIRMFSVSMSGCHGIVKQRGSSRSLDCGAGYWGLGTDLPAVGHVRGVRLCGARLSVGPPAPAPARAAGPRPATNRPSRPPLLTSLDYLPT